MPTNVFYVEEGDSLKPIKEELNLKFRVDLGIIKGYEKEKIIIINAGKRAVITLYPKKLVVQSSPEFQDLDIILNLVSKYFQVASKEEIPKDHIDLRDIDKKYFIGLDESGTGECFGSLFIGIAIFDKDVLFKLMEDIKPSDAKNFDLNEIFILNSEYNKFAEKKLKTISATEIDNTNKKILLDRKYKSLLEEEKEILKDSCIILDDYGIGTELENFFDKIRGEGAKVLLVHHADDYYLPPMIASIIARKARNTELSNLKNNNKLIDPDTGELIEMTSGNASDPGTNIWLRAYRKLYPSTEFPAFVRKKWANVKKVLEEYPIREIISPFKCGNCNKDSFKLQIRCINKTEITEMICPNCGRKISAEEFSKFWDQKPKIIVLDTSSVISRILSKDLSNTGYFRGFKVLLPSYVKAELDTKQPPKKAGGSNEIEALSQHKFNGNIEFQMVNTDDILHLKNDDKMINIARRCGAAVLTQDNLQGAMSTVSSGTFLFQVVQ